MKFEEYVKEMERLGWSKEELEDDFKLHEQAENDHFELPWFPMEKSKEQQNPLGDIE